MTSPSEDRPAALAGWSALAVEGPDAAKFLQSFCTNDVLRLAVGESCEAFFPDVKGRVLAFGWVGRVAEQTCLVLLWSDGAADLLAHLDRYLIREKAELSVLGPERSLYFVDGQTHDSDAWRIPTPALGEQAAVIAAAEPPAVDSIDPQSLEALRVERGLPRDRVDFDERSLPQESGRDATAISFKKGCYLGQETVARIDALGQVNRLLARLRFEGDGPSPGAELTHEGATVGRVTSVATTATGEAIGIGTVRRAHAAAGAVLRTPAGAARVQ